MGAATIVALPRPCTRPDATSGTADTAVAALKVAQVSFTTAVEDSPGRVDSAISVTAKRLPLVGLSWQDGVLPVVVESPEAPEVRWPARDLQVAVLTGPDEEASDSAAVATSGPLGAQLLLWETATAVAGRLLGINPFDQPDVESAKQAARGLLDERPEEEPPALSEAGIEVRGSAGLLDGVSDLAGAVAALLARLPDDGYLAVMAYADADRDAALEDVRTPLARRTERPVTFGWGPRFLHSTGQYHKGGPPKGVFLQVTTAEADDVDIPERPFTFGQLITAQSAGDARVLADHGRPVLRLHLTEPVSGVARLSELLA